MNLDDVRHVSPETRRHLWNWVKGYTGLTIPWRPVCEGHAPPFDLFAAQVLERPPLALWHGPRGAGKSFLSGLATHLTSRFNPRHGTRILGGSKAQSQQIYHAIEEAILAGEGPLGSDRSSIAQLLKESATYRNGSLVSILAASPTSVRGPHVPSLKLDEVDEIDPDIRESAFGMAMALRGTPASVLMTSTWHRVGGPMGELIERGRSGAFPTATFCIFEVLERCPEERSGANLEHCPACPLVKWCHEDRDRHPEGLPKAKRSNGHYSIDSLIQKTMGVSERVFDSDYLCKGPKAAGVWFTKFDASIGKNVSPEAEYSPHWPAHVSVDSGVFTGGTFFQVREYSGRQLVTVFADYLAEGVQAEENARAMLRLGEKLCNGTRNWRVSTDPAGGARNPIGPTVIAEYERVGLKGPHGIERWPTTPVADGLALLESFVCSADGEISLLIHPRCKATITALQHYRRAKRGGQWMDYPEDPQHPHEDLVDPLRGALAMLFPNGRRPALPYKHRHVGRVMY